MKFMFGGEDLASYFERMTYDGAIGIFFNGTWNGVLAYIIIGLICLLAVVGLISIIRLIFRPKKRKSKMSDTEKWMKTGKL